MKNVKNRLPLQAVFRHALIILVLAYLLFPIIVMVSTSFKPYSDIYAWPPRLIPENPTLSGFQEVLFNPAYQFARAFLNSLVLAVGSAALSLLLGIPSAYATSRFQFIGRNIFLFGVLTTQMISAALLIMPLYRVVESLNLLNTYIALIIGNSAFTLPVVTWLLHGYFRGVPVALEESAMVDGASRLGALFRIVLPVAAPGILVAGVYAFIFAWNDLVFALAFITDPEMAPVTRALDRFASENVVRWDLTMAASTLAVAPIAVLFAIMQKHLGAAFAAGSVKE